LDGKKKHRSLKSSASAKSDFSSNHLNKSNRFGAKTSPLHADLGTGKQLQGVPGQSGTATYKGFEKRGTKNGDEKT
jgi:hypothetical protein